jgi:hypothetical protein
VTRLYTDLQAIYKEAVCMMPIDDFEKNMSLISLERRINGMINMICDNMD